MVLAAAGAAEEEDASTFASCCVTVSVATASPGSGILSLFTSFGFFGRTSLKGQERPTLSTYSSYPSTLRAPAQRPVAVPWVVSVSQEGTNKSTLCKSEG